MLPRSEDDISFTRLVVAPRIEEDKAAEMRPLLAKSSSYAGTATASNCAGTGFYQKRRRRTASATSLCLLSDGAGVRRGRGQAFREGVGRAASETYLVTRLGFNLLGYLGVGYRWITRFIALGFYAFLLFPGFVQVGYYYFFSNQVRRGIVYGDQPRNRLDLYLPKSNNGPKPVVAFVTGGAWIIGYKAWGSLLGKQLSERDIMVACIDYRNFPQGTISDMVKDASQGISFVCNHIAEYGGDPNRIYLMGQSAGAHIAACALLEQAFRAAGEGESTSWSVSQIKAYFGLSGGKNFSAALQRVGVKSYSIFYEGRTHTDLFLQDPMRGGKDQLFEDLVSIIHSGDSEALAKDAVAPPRRRLVPEFMLRLARKVSPF
ncbi:probable isoprenylcysteine alpha-carbonyl methylesterase ICMEL2 isoform X2 [Diospyros lotus]|uniref:probable isoprenylcysteine alpha-carbonyl methylesterase ICMEL2 isoform X2 n=1 Tax=Diospyros lotus TaxID=55363 RepID=UPI00224FF2C0|nr:probable isoprenylcysteine alpha-carbonyl methylesterase ICMEL2 isoform X2 [Diospyros lotus]